MSAIEKIKDPILKEKVYEEWRKPDGHPDWAWTREYFSKLEKEEQERREKVFGVLNRLKEEKEGEEQEKKEESKPIIRTELPPIIEEVRKKPIEKKESSYVEIHFDFYKFLKYVLITLTLLVLLHFFFVGKFGLLPLILRAVGIVLLGYLIVFIYKKTKHIIPYTWLILAAIVIVFAHTLSTNDYSILKVSDTIIGIPQFTENLVYKLFQFSSSELIQKPEAIIGTGESLFRQKTPKETLEEKILELRNDSLVLERKIHDLINEQRIENGLSPLIWDENLAKIARYHSEDMARRNYFSHVSPEGEDLEARYKKFSYLCRISAGNLIYSGGENIFLTHIYSLYYYDPLTGEVTGYVFNSINNISYEVVNGWMNSPGHRQNILTPFFLREGIGVYVDSDGEIYITEDFC